MKFAYIASCFLLFAAGPALPAAVITWDGGATDGLWTSSGNWDTNTLPQAGDTVNISGVTVDTTGLPSSGALPNGAVINLTNATLTRPSGAIRLNGATINVNAGSSLTGDFWDLNNGTLSFADGSTASMSSFELKGTNTFNFALGPTGFSPTLNPTTFRTDGNNESLTPAQKVALSTWNVDMAAYTGGVGVITLIDFVTDGSRSGNVIPAGDNIDDAAFQMASLNILNAGSYTANIQWNDPENSVELNITSAAVPEPATFAVVGILLSAMAWRHRRRASLP